MKAVAQEQQAQTLEAGWQQVRARLQQHYGEAIFRSWLKPLDLLGMDNGRVTLGVPTRFIGVRARIFSRRSGLESTASVSGVRMYQGATAFTRMSIGDHSTARLRVNCRSAALLSA